jgi:predicted PurR-regulated permease PerM
MGEKSSFDRRSPTEDALRAIVADAGALGQRATPIIVICLIVIASTALGFFLYFARPLLIPISGAVVASVLLAPLANWLRRIGLPSGARAFVAVAFAFTMLVGALYMALQPGAAWLDSFPAVVGEAKEKLVGMQDAVNKVQDVSEQVSELTDLGAKKSEDVVVVEGPPLGDSLMASARTIIVQLIFATVLTFFFLSARIDIRRKLLLLRRDRGKMLKTYRMIKAIEEKVGAYMLTMLVINLGLGVCTALAMFFLGMKAPLVWGGLAAILNFIPYLGPVLLTSLLAISGVVQFDTALAMALPALCYITLNFIESNFVTPLMIGVRLTISPLAVILNISFWTWIWGPVGAIISIPLLVIFKTVCDYSDTLRPIGLMIGDAETFRPTKNLRQKLAVRNQNNAIGVG